MLTYKAHVRRFQSTLPRGERPVYPIKVVFHEYISIHAPARGATLFLRNPSLVIIFQSTLPRGERRQLCHPFCHAPQISIHAPARGATSTKFFLTKRSYNFNPRSREGSDYILGIYGVRGKNFNPRSREGSDCKNTQTTNIISVYFYLYYIIFVSLATNTAYITITKPSKCRCESPYTFC